MPTVQGSRQDNGQVLPCLWVRPPIRATAKPDPTVRSTACRQPDKLPPYPRKRGWVERFALVSQSTDSLLHHHSHKTNPVLTTVFRHMTFKPLILVPAIFALCCQAPQVRTDVDESVKIYFTPSGSPTAAIIETLDNARESVHVQAYSFTSAPIAAALKRAHDRGVAVRVILDKSQKSEKYSSATFLTRSGIPVWIDGKHAIAHNKVMIVDGSIVITGSFNFTRGAEERNAENLLVISDGRIANQYLANWEKCKAHSEEVQ